ncbi:hypothetical protein [Thiospirillum jenense]|nr:hypothetical protein [Thiospirillum jenense]
MGTINQSPTSQLRHARVDWMAQNHSSQPPRGGEFMDGSGG